MNCGFRCIEEASMTKYCVLYLVAGRERRSPWFLDQARAQRALEIIKRRYGDRAIIYWD